MFLIRLRLCRFRGGPTCLQPYPQRYAPSSAGAEKKREKTKDLITWLKRDWTADLITQGQSFDSFLQTITQWRKKAVTRPTRKRFHKSIERLLGYRTREQKIAIEALAITDLLDRTFLQAYVQWSQKRGMSSNTISTDVKAVIPIAQWQFHLSVPDENYSNPEPVKELRSYLKTILIDYGDRPLVSDEACAERDLTRQQCWEILDYLGWRCKDLENTARYDISSD
jgi:hypothetical protein